MSILDDKLFGKSVKFLCVYNMISDEYIYNGPILDLLTKGYQKEARDWYVLDREPDLDSMIDMLKQHELVESPFKSDISLLRNRKNLVGYIQIYEKCRIVLEITFALE